MANTTVHGSNQLPISTGSVVLADYPLASLVMQDVRAIFIKQYLVTVSGSAGRNKSGQLATWAMALNSLHYRGNPRVIEPGK